MLFGYRRYFAVLSNLALAAPLVVGFVRPDGPTSILKEGRRAAPAPRPSLSWEGLLSLPDQIDAYLRDHFGLRQKMIRAQKELTKALLARGSSSVLIGRDGRLFYLGDEMVRQSAGLVLRDQRVAEVADMLAAMNAALSRRGIRFLVAPPPNSSTIYQDDLPLWAQSGGRKTEYDLFLADLRRRGVGVVDLRPALKAARASGSAYRRDDTHWTMRGALAGFNAIAQAAGHPDWRLDPAVTLGPSVDQDRGDLARMLGVEGAVPDKGEVLTLPQGAREEFSPSPYASYVRTSGNPGPTVMIIGDSFTEGDFTSLLLPHVSRVVWLYHRLCGFDWKWIDEFRPDEVWWTPTERAFLCEPGAHPLDFAG